MSTSLPFLRLNSTKLCQKMSKTSFPSLLIAIQSVEIVEGNGGLGTVKKITTVEVTSNGGSLYFRAKDDIYVFHSNL
ncbi:hypothetical protein VNO77_23673 [Canavalia gladiata]|uniref:Uncharacterized protein n=1 Tax=Canavalia gladiata TaxID=3824 RepID=A0AAN9L871_CANGL